MDYKLFGIYTESEDGYLSILTHISKDSIMGIDFLLSEFDEITNKGINNWFSINYNNFKNGEVFHVDTDEIPDVFKNFGYLGQINDSVVQQNLKKYVEQEWWHSDLED